MTAILAMLILGLSVFGENGLMDYMRIKRATAQAKQNVERTERENKELKSEIDALKGDKVYLEKVAREKLNMIRSDEVLYQFDGGARK